MRESPSRDHAENSGVMTTSQSSTLRLTPGARTAEMKRTGSVDYGDKQGPLGRLYDRGAKPAVDDVREEIQQYEEVETNLEVRKGQILTSHYRLVSSFEIFEWSPTESDCVERFFSEQKLDPARSKKILTDIRDAGEEAPHPYKTILHLILHRESPPLKARLPLLRWAMKTYDRLYKIGVEDQTSILHIAVGKLKAREPQDDAIKQLVNLFPRETCELLNESQDKDELLGSIMPFILSSQNSQFLELFGRPPEGLETHRVRA